MLRSLAGELNLNNVFRYVVFEQRVKEAHTWVKQIIKTMEAVVPVFPVSKGRAFRAHWLSNYLWFSVTNPE